MGPLPTQIFALLTSGPGSLAYHLVLAFSVLGALQIALNQSRRNEFPHLRRLAVGLGVLLLLQLALFVVSGLAWQGAIDAGTWLPPIDRAVMLLSLVIIAWLWAFPDPSPGADAAALLLVLLGVTAAVLGALWWSNQNPALAYNHSVPDTAAQAAVCILAGIGCVVLLIRRSSGWVYGFYMLLVLAAGSAVYLLLPLESVAESGADYSGVVRLAQIAAFPFLLLLPQRFAPAQPEVGLKEESKEQIPPAFTAHRMYTDPQLWQSLMSLAAETEPDQVCRTITSTVGKLMQADLCLLTRPLDEGGNLVVRCGYDRSQGRYLESMAIDSRGLPTLAPALRSGRIRRLSMNGASPDTANLGRAFGLERTGNLLLLPILTPDGNPLAGLILLSPYSSKDWTPDEQESLNFLAKLLVHFLQRSEEMAGLKVDMSQVRQMARLSQDQAQEALDEKRKLQDQLAVAREDTDRDRSQLLTLTAAVATQTATQNTIDQLQTENEQLKEAVRWATEAASQQQQAAGGELRLALEEIALLNSMLGEGDQKIAEPREVQPELEPSTEQLDNIVSIAQDLRQPLSSIVGYSDFLLGESVGILGSQQRKYLDRIKVSTERMSRLVDDLLQATAIDPNITQLNLRDVDLSEVLNSVIADSSASMRRKKVTPHLEMPETPLQLTTDRRAFRKILNNLLQNAILTTPEGGEILFKVRLQTSEGNEDYVLVQMTDSGPGIASQDLLRVFSARTAEDHISGISGVDLLAVKTLVEALGGRMWVDSELGQGATFSVLLPVHPASETFPAEGDEIS